MWYKKQNGSLVEIKETLYKSARIKIVGDFSKGVDEIEVYIYSIISGQKTIFETEIFEEREKEFEKIYQKLLTR